VVTRGGRLGSLSPRPKSAPTVGAPQKQCHFRRFCIAQNRTKNGPLNSIAIITEHDDRAQNERKLERAQWLYYQLVADCSTLSILKSYLDDLEEQFNALLNQSPDSAS
jgi:hypothetical protein